MSLDPGISEWGNPACYMQATAQPIHNCAEATQGTETSKYLEEKKERSIPLVVASERGTAQTGAIRGMGGT